MRIVSIEHADREQGVELDLLADRRPDGAFAGLLELRLRIGFPEGGDEPARLAVGRFDLERLLGGAERRLVGGVDVGDARSGSPLRGCRPR